MHPCASYEEAEAFGESTGWPYEIDFNHVTWTYWVRWKEGA